MPGLLTFVSTKRMLRPMEIGSVIRRLRWERNLSQDALSAMAGLAKNTVSRIENGENQPREATLAVIAEALGVSVSDLVDHAANGSRTTDRPSVQNGSPAGSSS